MFQRPAIKYLLIPVLLMAAIGGYYAYTEYNRRAPDMADVKSAFELTDAEILSAFESKIEESKQRYIDQVLEIKGSVKAIEKDEKGFYTVVLGGEGSLSAVRCVVDSLYSSRAATLSVGVYSTLRGICVGYTADDMGLGADILLNRCYPLHK